MATEDVLFLKKKQPLDSATVVPMGMVGVFADEDSNLRVRQPDGTESTPTGNSTVDGITDAGDFGKDLLRTETLQDFVNATGLEANVFDTAKAQGNIATLAQALVDPATNDGAWYIVTAASGDLSGTNSGGIAVLTGQAVVASGGVYVAVTLSTMQAENALGEIASLGDGPVLLSRQNIKASSLEEATPSMFTNVLRQMYRTTFPENPKAVSSVSRSGSTVTVNCTNHGLRPRDTFLLSGANEEDYNLGWRVVTTPTLNQLTFLMDSGATPTSPATGAITLTPTAQVALGTLGDSVANQLPQHIIPQIRAGLSLNGLIFRTTNVSGDAWLSSTEGGSFPYDYTISFAGSYASLGSGTGIVTYASGGVTFECDFAAVYLVKEPGAGIVKLQQATNTGSPSGWTDIPGNESIDLSSATKEMLRIVIRRPISRFSLRVVHLSGGRARSISPNFRCLGQSGWVTTPMQRGGMEFGSTTTWLPEFRDPQITDMAPSLLFAENKENLVNIRDNFSAFVDIVRSLTNCDFVLIGTPPDSGDAAFESDPYNSPTYLTNFELMKIAEIRNLYYFDSWRPIKTYQEMLRLGFLTTADGVHTTPIGNWCLAASLSSKLSFLMSVTASPFNVNASRLSVQDRINFGGSSTQTVLPLNNAPHIKTTPGAGGIDLEVNASRAVVFKNPATDSITARLGAQAGISYLPTFAQGGPSGFWLLPSSKDASSTVVLRSAFSASGAAPTDLYLETLQGLRWVNTIASGAMAEGRGVRNSHPNNNPTTFTLPAVCRVGERVAASSGTGVATIAQNDSQRIRAGTNVTTVGVGGSVTIPLGCSIILRCVVENLEFEAESMVGTLTWV